jgi:hypothetical protein
MIVDKVKEVQLVPESRALKLDAATNSFQRFDKTIYAVEESKIKIQGSGEAYVEALKFFNLFPETKDIEIHTDFVLLRLKNGAEYKLPFLDVSWNTNELPNKFNKDNSISIKLVSGRLNSATLKNLANPMLQCIYIDNTSAVSCNSMVACLDGTATTITPLLLPPDIAPLMEGREAYLEIIDNNYVVKMGEEYVVCPIPAYDYSGVAQTLRNSLPASIKQYPVGSLYDSVRRLSMFGDKLTFDGEKVLVEENYEPFNLPSAVKEFKYGIQYLLTVLPQVTHIAQSEFALLLYGDKFLFMISPEDH